MTRYLDGLAELAARYDHYLVDQFGVLLSGSGAYIFAPAALAQLAGMGKTIVLLSNSGKRAAPNIARLRNLGFLPGSFAGLVSSGEVAHDLLRRRDLPLGTRFLLVGRGGDTTATEGLGLRQADTAADADLVIISGAEPERFTRADYARLLAPAAERGLPALCTNPDLVMLTDGGLAFAAGQIAQDYVGMGGQVEWVGKPYAAVYAAGLAALGSPDPARVVCIGDSLDHDIAGGASAGLSTALVRTGVLAEMSPAELASCLAAAPAQPDFILPKFMF